MLWQTFTVVFLSTATRVSAQDDANYYVVDNDIGGLCLDGSFPSFYHRPATGDGVNKWAIYLQGGAWCYDENDCLGRSRGALGSSRFNLPSCNATDGCAFGGIMSANPADNPDFYNWNIARLMYCDGASFAGNVDEPVVVNGTTLYFRGIRVLDALIQRLLEIGMASATDLVYSGASAGGLAAMVTMDRVRSRLPSTIRMRGLADCGWFLDVPPRAPSTSPAIRTHFQDMFRTHRMDRGGVNERCVADQRPEEQWKCVFPEYLARYVATPMFVLNSPYDTWQLDSILRLGCRPPNCSPEQQEAFDNFRVDFDERFLPYTSTPNAGWFINSCLVHGQIAETFLWNYAEIGNQTAARTFANWFFERSPADGPQSLIDDNYPSEISFCPVG